jgi:hypothetical protein
MRVTLSHLNNNREEFSSVYCIIVIWFTLRQWHSYPTTDQVLQSSTTSDLISEEEEEEVSHQDLFYCYIVMD